MLNNFFSKYRPLFQLAEGGGTGTAAPSGGSDPGSTPASTPSVPASTPSTPASEPSSDVGGDVADFSFIFGDGETEPVVAPSVPPAAKPKVEPQVVAKAPGAEPAKPAPVEVKPAVEVAPAAPAPTESTSPQSGNLDPYDPGALASALAANEAQAIEHVAQTMFKLSPEEIEGLESNTVEAIPKLLARSFVRAQQNMLQQMSRLFPAMMMRQTAMLQRHSENEGKFYSQWPDIKAAEHGKLVRQYAAVYRQMNPDATLEKMIEDVGPMVMMAAKIAPQAPAAAAGSVVKPSPMASNGTRPAQPTPFAPAAAVGGGALPQSAPELTPIETMFLGNEE